MLSLSVCQSFYGNPLARPLLKKPGTLVNIKTAAWMFIPKKMARKVLIHPYINIQRKSLLRLHGLVLKARVDQDVCAQSSD